MNRCSLKEVPSRHSCDLWTALKRCWTRMERAHVGRHGIGVLGRLDAELFRKISFSATQNISSTAKACYHIYTTLSTENAYTYVQYVQYLHYEAALSRGSLLNTS